MLRLVLLLLYLMGSSTSSLPTKGGSGADPLGLNKLPPPPQTDGGSGYDPLG